MRVQSKARRVAETPVLVPLLTVCFLFVSARAVTNCGGRQTASGSESFFQNKTIHEDDAPPRDQRPPSATVRGLVIDARTRLPVVGARVSLEPGRVPDDPDARGRETGVSALTDDRGRFRLERVEPGVYRLVAA